ncbi:MAG: NUDIX domain-containing protein [Lentimicrobium sp.]
MPSGIKVSILSETKENFDFQYAVIASRFKNQWIFVRHRDRDTWEIPGGHIEPGESPDKAASRELMEETGTIDFTIHPVAAYSVIIDEKTTYGWLYFAEVHKLGKLPDSEIAEIMFLKHLPGKLTYPLIQPILFEEVIKFLEKKILL